MYQGMGDPFTDLFNVMMWIIIFSVPMAIWKWIEIFYWLYLHIDISFV